jgi:hypothetical protein
MHKFILALSIQLACVILASAQSTILTTTDRQGNAVRTMVDLEKLPAKAAMGAGAKEADKDVGAWIAKNPDAQTKEASKGDWFRPSAVTIVPSETPNTGGPTNQIHLQLKGVELLVSRIEWDKDGTTTAVFDIYPQLLCYNGLQVQPTFVKITSPTDKLVATNGIIELTLEGYKDHKLLLPIKLGESFTISNADWFLTLPRTDSVDSNSASTITAGKQAGNKQVGITFLVPKGIEVYSAENPGSLGSRISTEEPYILVNPDFHDENVNIKIADGVTESDLNGMKEMLDSDPNMPLPGYKRIAVRNLNIGKNGAIKAVEHEFQVQGNVLGRMRSITFVLGNRGFTVTCATAVERFETANKHFFQPFLDSIEPAR